MRKRIIILTLLWGSFYLLKSQNLVLNPSFEEKKSCDWPYWIDSITYNWTSPINHHGKPTYLHKCINTSSNSVPANDYGFQDTDNPMDSAYVEMILSSDAPTFLFRREYLTGELSAPLEADHCYEVSFTYSLADFSLSATKNVDIYFSDSIPIHPDSGNANPLDVVPQIRINRLLNDKNNWVELKRYYVSKGGEKHITIGNFLNDEETEYIWVHDSLDPTVWPHLASIYIDEVNVKEVPFDSVSRYELASDTTLCEGEQLEISLPATNGIYLWNNCVADSQIVIDSAGTYWYESFKGCSYATDTIHVHYLTPQQSQIETVNVDSSFCNEEEIWLSAGNSDSINTFLWNTGETTPQISVSEQGIYTVAIKNECNEGISTFDITLQKSIVYDYNVFTPNKDGENDFFTIYEGDASDYKLEIYNRWGRLIWETGNPNEHWDGGNVSDGVYYYHLRFTNCANEAVERKGTVTITR